MLVTFRGLWVKGVSDKLYYSNLSVNVCIDQRNINDYL